MTAPPRPIVKPYPPIPLGAAWSRKSLSLSASESISLPSDHHAPLLATYTCPPPQSAVQVCLEAGVPLIINDRIDIALALGPDVGVHVGQVRPRSLPPCRTVDRCDFLFHVDSAFYSPGTRLWLTSDCTLLPVPVDIKLQTQG